MQLFLAHSPVTVLSSGLFSLLRIEAGLPRIGVDTNDRTLVQEADLTDRTVSFSKGCYLGQETVARVAHRGAVRKRLRGVKSATELTVGQEITAGTEILGTLTSAVQSPNYGHIGLAILRDSADAGDAVQVGKTPAEVTRLPFGS